MFVHIVKIAPMSLKIDMDLLNVVKKEIGLRPSRKMLDFLMDDCVNNKALCEVLGTSWIISLFTLV